MLAAMRALPTLFAATSVVAQTEPLTSWNDGPVKQAILDFVKTTTDCAGPNFGPPKDRFAAFDQDGTLWVEHPLYTRALDRLHGMAPHDPLVTKCETKDGNPELIRLPKLSSTTITKARNIDLFVGKRPSLPLRTTPWAISRCW